MGIGMRFPVLFPRADIIVSLAAAVILSASRVGISREEPTCVSGISLAAPVGT